MTTSPALGQSLEEQIQELFKFLPARKHAVIDEPDTRFTLEDPLASITIIDAGRGSSVFGYADVDNFVLKPYADHIDGWVMGGVESLQATNVWYADLVFGGGVEDVHLERFDHSQLAVYGNVDNIELFDSVDSSFAFYGHTDDADVSWVQDSDLTFSEVGGVLEIDGVNDSAVQVGFADNAVIEIEDVQSLVVDIISADESEIELEETAGLALKIDQGDVLLEGEDVSDSTIDTGWGNDYVNLEEVTQTTIATGMGNDDVMLSDADQTAVHTGAGDDFLTINDQAGNAQVAYNLADGRDFGYIDGGNTLGMTLDGDTDTLVFNTADGGNHEVVADATDQLYLQTETGLWDAHLVDFIDQGGQDGVAQWEDFSLTIHTSVVETVDVAHDDFFLG